MHVIRAEDPHDADNAGRNCEVRQGPEHGAMAPHESQPFDELACRGAGGLRRIGANIARELWRRCCGKPKTEYAGQQEECGDENDCRLGPGNADNRGAHEGESQGERGVQREGEEAVCGGELFAPNEQRNHREFSGGKHCRHDAGQDVEQEHNAERIDAAEHQEEGASTG